MDYILSVNNLTKKFSNFIAVDNISFGLKQGEILGLLGPNGAGKTTTINMLLDLLTPSSGFIEYFGQDFQSNKQNILEQISFASSYIKLPRSLTVYENLKFFGKIYCLENNFLRVQIEKNISIFGLDSVKDRLTKDLSAGQLTRLMLAKAFLSNPKVILLDEPTAALDPDITLVIREFILKERESLNISILLTSHNMIEVQEMCDRVIMLKDGKILDIDTPQGLASRVKISKVRLLVSENFKELVNYLKKINLNYRSIHNLHNFLEIDISEQKIPELIFDITHIGVKYTQISIERPSLEDYFLKIAKN
ncbi:MAG: ABC transporter ATP-binding protein [Novosphingobium sp.]|nr:ABC transporter ATP-binding protein [Novosphingobium sp.]